MAVEPAIAYQVLGLPFGAPSPDVRKAFRRLSLQLHPDKSTSPTATADFQHLLEAYEVLKLPRILATKRPFEETESQPSHHNDHNETECTDEEEECASEGDSADPCGYGSYRHQGWGKSRRDCSRENNEYWSNSDEDEDDDDDEDPDTEEATGTSKHAAEDSSTQQAETQAQFQAALEAAAVRGRAWEEGRSARAESTAAARVFQAAAAAEATAAAKEWSRERAASAQKAAAAAEAEAAQRRAPLVELQRRTQEHLQHLIGVRAAAALASAREKAGLADLLKFLIKSKNSLEHLARVAEAAQLDHERLEAEARVVWARHLPNEEREDKRLKAFADKTARFTEAGRRISIAEEKLNALNIRKAAEHRATVSRSATLPESNAALAQERQLEARGRAAGLLSKALAGVDHQMAAQEEANRTSGVLRGAEEELLHLMIASAKARIQLLSILSPISQMALDDARQKYRCAQQELKEQRIATSQQIGDAMATRFVIQAKEMTAELQAIYSKM